MTTKLLEDLESIYYNTENLIKKFNKKTIFITGGTGFIGKWILEYFIYLEQIKAINCKIIVLSRNPSYFLEMFPKFNVSFIQFVKGEILEFDYNSLPHSDIIIHAATDADAKLNYEQPLKMIDTIVEGTRRVFDYGVRVKANKVLYLSSGAVYGVQPDDLVGFSENYFGGPNILSTSSAYSEAKRLAEHFCVCYQKQYQLNVTIARCFAFVGPYLPLDTHFAIGNFITNGLRKEAIIIRGNGLPLRSYMYPVDLIIWLLTILVKGNTGEAYNVGSDVAISIKDVANIVANFFSNTEVKILNQVSLLDRNQNYVPDIKKVENDFGLKITVNLETAISKTINFYR